VQLIRELTKPRASYPKIGREMGRRHHSTIITLERRAHDLMDMMPELYDRRQAALRRLGFD
jgi:chromosomal replication initiation ATPase DnaA